jgi:hypothetical protein
MVEQNMTASRGVLKWRHEWQDNSGTGTVPGGNGSAKYRIRKDKNSFTLAFYRGKTCIWSQEDIPLYRDAMRMAQEDCDWRLSGSIDNPR